MNPLLSRFRHIPIRWKIVVMMLGVSAISLLLVSAGLLLHTRVAFEDQMQKKLVLLADVLGLNSKAALAFRDPQAATETLSALASDAHVTAGALYDLDENLFARYQRAGSDQTAVPDFLPDGPSWALERQQARIKRAITVSGRTIGTVYLASDVTEWNQTLARFLQIMGLLLFGVLAVGFLVAVWMQRAVTEPIMELVQLTRRVGQERDFSLRAVKRGNDELGTLVDGFDYMLDEISKGRSEIEQARDELRHLNEDLEQRVAERTAQLEIAYKELESFSYSVSHDLRAPLRAIDGFSSILLVEHGDKLDASGRDSLERVRKAAQRMALLIDDLLKLARVTRTDPVREDVDLSAIAQDVVEGLHSQNRERSVSVVIEPGLKAQGDARLIRVAFENLLGNAWKFTGNRDDARIEFGRQHENAESVFYVRDNGAGFDMAYANKLFTPFQRLHTAEEFPGTGIGLATVLRVVSKHGGRIWAEGEKGRGAAFYFTL